jgi:hypothetical protein
VNDGAITAVVSAFYWRTPRASGAHAASAG